MNESAGFGHGPAIISQEVRRISARPDGPHQRRGHFGEGR